MALLLRAYATSYILFCLSFLRCVEAATNVTVDDQYGDEVTGALPSYSPATSWLLGTTCTGCLVNPDSSQAYRGTWHESTRKLGNTSFTIEISFTGTAVYAYFILPNYTQGTPVKTDMSFSLDWNDMGEFEYDPGTNANVVYNALGYSAMNLENTTHTFVVNSVVDDPDGSTILFDRLVYTTEDASAASNVTDMDFTRNSTMSSTEYTQGTSSSGTKLPTLSAPQASTSTSTSSASTISSNKTHTAIIGGSVAGGVSVLLAAAIALLCIRRRRRRNATAVNSLRFTPSDKANMPESIDQGSIDEDEQGTISIRQSVSNFFMGSKRTDSLAVLPPSSVVYRTTADSRPEELPQLEKDPFQRDIFDEKQERLAARSRSSPSDRAGSNPWTSPTNGTKTQRSSRTERMLLEYIASLQAEVDRLQDRHSTADMPPPPSYGDAGGRLV